MRYPRDLNVMSHSFPTRRSSNISVAVSSPISNRSTTQSLDIGTFLQPETELFRIADPKQFQVEAAILPSDIFRIAPGDRAIVELPGGGTLEAKVGSVTPSLNTATRQATAVLDVEAGVLHPGLVFPLRIFHQKP